MTDVTQHPPGRDLLQRVRAGFVAQGTSYTAWCKKHSIQRANCTQAIVGSWDGTKARALRDRVIRAAKVAA